jgi:8-oxo-dGTP diphosphatase
LPDLAFDHSKIINDAIFRLKGKIRYQPVGLELLPEVFPFKEVQTLYESILNVEFNRGNFRTKFMKLGVIEETNEIEEGVPHRPAKMFRFNKSKYWQKQKDGMYFEI